MCSETSSLQILEPEQFLALLSYVRGVSIQHMQHVRLVHRLINGLLKRSKASRTLMPACDAEFQLVLQSVSEAAHGRWIKLLASRSHSPPLCSSLFNVIHPLGKLS